MPAMFLSLALFSFLNTAYATAYSKLSGAKIEATPVPEPSHGLELLFLHHLPRAGPDHPPVQEVKPMFGLAALARTTMISAAVWPWAAQCILFCTTLKNSRDMSVSES
jgi:hypothetical protein